MSRKGFCNRFEFTTLVLSLAFISGVRAQDTNRSALSRDESSDVVAPGSSPVTAARLLYLYRISLAHEEWLANNAARTIEILNECPVALRGWEWGYLKRLCHTELRSFFPAVREVDSVAFASDGKRIAYSTLRETRILYVETGETLRTLEGGRAAFSADGGRIATAGFKNVAVFNAETGEQLFSVEGHDLLVRCVTFSPDGKRLASSSGVRRTSRRALRRGKL